MNILVLGPFQNSHFQAGLTHIDKHEYRCSAFNSIQNVKIIDLQWRKREKMARIEYYILVWCFVLCISLKTPNLIITYRQCYESQLG